MPEPSSEYMTHREARALADSLAGYGGKMSAAARVAAMERHCKQAGRLIRAMLQQTHESDVFRLPPEEA